MPVLRPAVRAVAIWVVGIALLTGATVAPAPASDGTRAMAAADSGQLVDPATWGDRRLAAQLTFSCVDLSRLDEARRQAAAGIGGITLLGDRPPTDLARQLGAVGAAAPTRVRPFLASDEEGGAVQRLRRAIYPLPSARVMGSWPVARVRETARAYAVRMRRVGVRMDLGPVADVAAPGGYIDGLERAFSADPERVARRVRAWRLGMSEGGVVTVLKHWPGHGSAGDSHRGPARIAALSVLRTRDLVPFDRELSHGAPVVMVGHLLSTGLTRHGVPTSQSPRALRLLRRSAEPSTVVVTDSLSMAAASSSLGISPERAAVRALRAGADWAMVCGRDPFGVLAAIRTAIERGGLPRQQAVTSVRRILALKARWGLGPRLAPVEPVSGRVR